MLLKLSEEQKKKKKGKEKILKVSHKRELGKESIYMNIPTAREDGRLTKIKQMCKQRRINQTEGRVSISMEEQ